MAGARTVAGRLVAGGRARRCWRRTGAVTHLFPDPRRPAGRRPPPTFAMPASRRQALRALAGAVADGEAGHRPGRRSGGGRPRLRRPARASARGPPAYVAMRALGDPDAFIPTDLGVRRGLEPAGRADDPAAVQRLAERWRPWRAYATVHLWAATEPATLGRRRRPAGPDEAQRKGACRMTVSTVTTAAATGPKAAFRLVVDSPVGPLAMDLGRRVRHPPVPPQHRDGGRRRLAGSSPRAAPLGGRPSSTSTSPGGAPPSTFPLAPSGTPFQRRVWRDAGRHPLRTDHQLRRAGARGWSDRPPSGRSGQANGANPLPIFYPLPPGDRLRGRPRRLRRRARREAAAAGAGRLDRPGLTSPDGPRPRRGTLARWKRPRASARPST